MSDEVLQDGGSPSRGALSDAIRAVAEGTKPVTNGGDDRTGSNHLANRDGGGLAVAPPDEQGGCRASVKRGHRCGRVVAEGEEWCANHLAMGWSGDDEPSVAAGASATPVGP